MATATVSLKVSPNELQFIRAALECYVKNIKASEYKNVDLAPAEMEPGRAVTKAYKLLQDIGMK